MRSTSARRFRGDECVLIRSRPRECEARACARRFRGDECVLFRSRPRECEARACAHRFRGDECVLLRSRPCEFEARACARRFRGDECVLIRSRPCECEARAPIPQSATEPNRTRRRAAAGLFHEGELVVEVDSLVTDLPATVETSTRVRPRRTSAAPGRRRQRRSERGERKRAKQSVGRTAQRSSAGLSGPLR
jgi:hypothetical protein